MSTDFLTASPHRRFNALTREWVLVSPHRTQRPWQGQTEKPLAAAAITYDPQCYLCPGNVRANGEVNPAYAHTFVFQNDFAALMPDAPTDRVDQGGLIVAQGEPGICRVLCFSPRHDLTLAKMDIADIARVVDLWADQTVELGANETINAVQIFENRGAMMGASNPHPHCQIWATHSPPNEMVKELASQSDYFAAHGTTLLGDYLKLELDAKVRLVWQDENVAVLVPFWAVWPFETLVLPRRAVGSLDQLSAAERRSLAEALSVLTRRYDAVFDAPFPYSMGFHQRPTDGQPHPEWHLHAHFYPPLLRSATVRKFMVGFEMLGSPQRDITPETAAERLR